MKNLAQLLVLAATAAFGVYEALFANIPVDSQMGCMFVAACAVYVILAIIGESIVSYVKKLRN